MPAPAGGGPWADHWILSSIVNAPRVRPEPDSVDGPTEGVSEPTASGVTVAVKLVGVTAVTVAVWLLKNKLVRNPDSRIVSPTAFELLAVKVNDVPPAVARDQAVMLISPAQAGSDAPDRPSLNGVHICRLPLLSLTWSPG